MKKRINARVQFGDHCYVNLAGATKYCLSLPSRRSFQWIPALLSFLQTYRTMI